MAAPRRYRDPFTGEDRILAPRRAARPHRPSAGGCPFCPGSEDQTPAEISRIADGDDWQARVVPNLYPLGEVHEIVVMTPRHIESVRELVQAEWHACAELLLQRYAELYAHRPGDVVCSFVNDGERAGASIPHAHMQIVSMPESARSRQWMDGMLDRSSCAVCALTGNEELHVASANGIVVCAHPAPRAAGALVATPTRHHSSLDAIGVAGLSRLLSEIVRAATPSCDFNLILYARGDARGHLYAELLPRVGYLAGLELGMGIGVSTRAPSDVASALRPATG